MAAATAATGTLTADVATSAVDMELSAGMWVVVDTAADAVNISANQPFEF
jgi:hypothetical protein